jgi:hypothetical protein
VTVAWWQRLLLAIVLFSSGGTLTELFLLEHTEEFYQLIPVILLGITFLATIGMLLKPGKGMVTTYRIIMALCLVSALVGIFLHYQANVEFVLERHPKYAGMTLFKEAVMGALPALAPGAMAQMSLIGLLATLSRRSA